MHTAMTRPPRAPEELSRRGLGNGSHLPIKPRPVRFDGCDERRTCQQAATRTSTAVMEDDRCSVSS
jgi:hypothetical protein